MGQKIPRGNDGSNYYAAREYNSNDIIYESALDALASNPCGEVWSHSGYSRQSNAYVLAAQPKQGKKTYINGNLGTFVGMDISVSSNDVWQPIQADWSNGTYIVEHTFTSGGTLIMSPEDAARLQEEYIRVPDDHEFTPNFWGQCDICPGHNMYRREMNAHLFVIEEEPCLQDWRSLLAS